MKRRVTISIGQKLHRAAVQFVKSEEMDFSEYVSMLIRNDLREKEIPIGSHEQVRLGHNFIEAGYVPNPEIPAGADSDAPAGVAKKTSKKPSADRPKKSA